MGSSQYPATHPAQQPMAAPNQYMGNMPGQFSNLSLSPQNSFNNGPSMPQPVNLLSNRHILPSKSLLPVSPKVPEQYKGLNCDPTVMRCTINAIPHKQDEITK